MPGTALNLVCFSASVRGGEASVEPAEQHKTLFCYVYIRRLKDVTAHRAPRADAQGRTVTVAPVSSVAGGTLALEGLALQRNALGRGVTVVVPRVARVDQLRPCWLHCTEEETRIK